MRRIDYADSKDMSQICFAFTENRSVIVKEGNLNEKTLFSQGERLIRHAVTSDISGTFQIK